MHRIHSLLFIPTALALSACATHPRGSLTAQAHLTRAQAEARALKAIPDGKVKEAELEEERGVLVWSFDIAQPGTKNITEIQIDARDGKLVRREIESPRMQAREAAQDREKKI